jgi:DNA primase
MENPVEEIKKRIDIVEFIGSFITLKKAGRNFKALCPFHQEKTPSFIVSPERQIWHCFGACGEGGDVIKFLMKWENVTFFEALKDLAKKVGVRLREVSFEDKIWRQKERFIGMNQLAAEFFEYILHKSNFGKKALQYLKRREINLPTAKRFQLGYAPQSWNSLLRFLKKKKFEETEMLENGLLVKSEKGGYYDRFRGRLIFPIKDGRGNVIGFSGRHLEETTKEAKYINTPETLLYHKRETLFGIDLAKEAIKKEKNVFIVEGEFDIITPYQKGLTNFVAIKGSALTRQQLMFLKRYTPRITLALDADWAGEEAVRRGIEEAEQLELEIEVVNFDFAKDPDEAVRADLLQFKKILQRAVPIYDFLITVAQKKYPGDDPFNKKKIGEEVIPAVSRIANPIVQSHYIKKLADLLGVAESSIERMAKKIKRQKKQLVALSSIARKTRGVSRELLLENYILSLIFQKENPYKTADIVFSIVNPSDFSAPSHRQICQLFWEFQNKASAQFDLAKFTSTLSKQLQPVFDEVYLFASTEHEFGSEKINKLAYEVKRFALKRKIKEILSKGEDIAADEKRELSDLTANLKEVEKMIITL